MRTERRPGVTRGSGSRTHTAKGGGPGQEKQAGNLVMKKGSKEQKAPCAQGSALQGGATWRGHWNAAGDGG